MLLAKIEYLTKRLQSFRKYIEKYDCVTFGCPRTAEDQFDGLLFYHANTDMPYVMILDYLDYEKHPWVEIYVNVNGDNWIKSFQPNTAKCVSNDMNGFIKAIRECKEYNIKKLRESHHVITNKKVLNDLMNKTKPKGKIELVEPKLPEYER